MTLTTIAGRILFDFMPEFSSPPTIIGSRQSDITGLSQARRIAQFSGKKPVHSLNHQYRLTTREDILGFSAFIEAVSGKWRAFWLPSWHAELNPVDGILKASPLLKITPVNYNSAYKLTTVDTRLGRYIWALHRSGEVLTSRVSALSIGNPEVLTLETAPKSDWTQGEFVAGFLYYVRLASDKITVDFSGANEASCQLSFIEAINVTDQAASAGTSAAGDPITTEDPPAETPPSGDPAFDPFTTATGGSFEDAEGKVFTT
jgi:hypothetical protein